jgi:hypothetical protein
VLGCLLGKDCFTKASYVQWSLGSYLLVPPDPDSQCHPHLWETKLKSILDMGSGKPRADKVVTCLYSPHPPSANSRCSATFSRWILGRDDRRLCLTLSSARPARQLWANFSASLTLGFLGWERENQSPERPDTWRDLREGISMQLP